MVNLGCTDPRPSELRLQTHREVFEYLIEDFKTYKPLLSQVKTHFIFVSTVSYSLDETTYFLSYLQIKNEYEKMLSHYRQRIHELEPLKAMLVTVSEQCDQKIMKIREEV